MSEILEFLVGIFKEIYFVNWGFYVDYLINKGKGEGLFFFYVFFGKKKRKIYRVEMVIVVDIIFSVEEIN